jgi:uncharacterized protein YqhQ
LPGGLARCDAAEVDRGAVSKVLAAADGSAALPRLGGMARADGVVIASERFWAFATRDGGLREGAMPSAPKLLHHLPLLRGLARLASALTPLFRGAGVAGRSERLVLVAALLAPLSLIFLPQWASLPLGITTAVVLLVWMLRGRTLFLHGAEHRAIAAAEERRLVATWLAEARPSRFAPRCGTNFAALVVPVSLAFDRLWPLPATLYTPFVVTLLSLALTMELWQVVQASRSRLARAFLLPGLALQRLTTREPADDETRLALTAVASVLRRELP